MIVRRGVSSTCPTKERGSEVRVRWIVRSAVNYDGVRVAKGIGKTHFLDRDIFFIIGTFCIYIPKR